MKKLIALLFVFMCSFAFADEAWVLCTPDTYVNTRPTPSTRFEPNGVLGCGWKAEAKKTKNGFVYFEIANEGGYGQVSEKYIVYSEPVIRTFKTNIYSDGRVTCRKGIKGERNCFADEGEVVTVYAISKEWAVTDKGFIQTEYLGVSYEQLYKTRLEARQSYSESTDLHWEDD